MEALSHSPTKIKDEADMSYRQALNELLRIVNNEQTETVCVKGLYEKVFAACEKADHDDIFKEIVLCLRTKDTK